MYTGTLYFYESKASGGHDLSLIHIWEEIDEVKALLAETMKHAADLKVSLEVEANVGESWFDAK